jgi:hypothetical protein
MSQPRDDRQNDLFRPPPEKIINLRQPPVRRQVAALPAAAGSAMRVQVAAQAPGLKTRTPSFARPPAS